MAGPGRSGPPVGRVTEARARTLQLLLEREGQFVPSPELARLAGLTAGATYASLRGMAELGWVELQVDDGTERRRGVGARGRKPRHAYKITAKGKVALVEGLMGGLSKS